MTRKQLLTLFTDKDMYLMSRTKRGKDRRLMELSKTKRRKMEYNNLHLTENMEFSDENGFPIVKPYSGKTDWEYHPYNDYRKLDGKNQAIHFFTDDYKFMLPTWDKLEETTMKLSKFNCLLAPDYSLYVDAPMFVNKMNIYKSRFAAAFWQNCGLNVIPVASWGGADTFSFCFESLPKNSIIAVCGVGIRWSKASILLWQYGIRALEETLTPQLILVYGEFMDISGIQTPIIFLPDTISKFYRNAKAI